VRDLRDSLHITLLDAAGLVPQHPGPAAAALQHLHGRWVAAVARSALRVDRDAAKPLRLAVGLTPDFQIQDRIAVAVMDLMLTVDYGRLRRCPPEDGGCGWIVLDQSRNGSRRWCQMADCGSAARLQSTCCSFLGDLGSMKSFLLTHRERAAGAQIRGLPGAGAARPG
jgi:hypothetical protein